MTSLGQGGGQLVVAALPHTLVTKGVRDFAWHVGLIMFRKHIGCGQFSIADATLCNNALSLAKQAWQRTIKDNRLFSLAIGNDEV